MEELTVSIDDFILEDIKNNNLFSEGDNVGVAVSGGIDSMALLFFLNKHKKKLGINLLAITVDHCLREKSSDDASFVCHWCDENDIPCKKFSVNVAQLAQNNKLNIELAARDARYAIFESLIAKGVVNKIALAHHQSDQFETILLHLFRGAGINGAIGMEPVRGYFVRPFLNIEKNEILAYAFNNNIPHIEDETNLDNTYNRNYLRNIIIPQIKDRWPNVEKSLLSFSKSCKNDNDFILSQIQSDAMILDGNVAKIPMAYFIYPSSAINRIIIKAFEYLKITVDMERKHISSIKLLAKGENGKRIFLPNNSYAIKEYEYVTIVRREKKPAIQPKKFKLGSTKISDNCTIVVEQVNKIGHKEGYLYLDADKLPKGVVWRGRLRGDRFNKFGGIKTSIKELFIEKKIPSRLRENMPLLALNNEIYCVLGIDISNDVRVDENSKNIYAISVKSKKI